LLGLNLSGWRTNSFSFENHKWLKKGNVVRITGKIVGDLSTVYHLQKLLGVENYEWIAGSVKLITWEGSLLNGSEAMECS
jgi:hypothetical protein